MTSKQWTLVGRVNDLLSLLALAASSAAMPHLVTPITQIVAAAVVAAALGRLAYSGHLRIKELRRARTLARQEDLPRLILLGGPKSEKERLEIAYHPRLLDDPYITIIPVGLPEQDLHAKVLNAHGVILMHDFTKSAYPDEYRFLRWVNKRWLMPLSRYYGKNFTGERTVDGMLPFETPQALVNYATEKLFMQNVLDLRSQAARVRLYQWCLAMTCSLIIALGVQAVRSRVELAQGQRIAATRPAERELLRQVRFAASPQASAAVIKDVANAVVKLAVDDINRQTQDYGDKAAYVYMTSKTADLVLPVVAWGPKGYPLPAKDSIAACAMRNNVAVYWSGDANRTTRITALSPDGELVGTYDQATGTLRLGLDTCTFFKGPQSDHKDQLLCVPIGVTDGAASGSFCLETRKAEIVLNQQTVVETLLDKATLLAMVDLNALLDSRGASDTR